MSAIFSLVQYSLKVTVTNSDNFNTINKLGKEAGGGRAKKITRVEIFYRHLTGYVQDRVGLAGTGHAAARGGITIIISWVAEGSGPQGPVSIPSSPVPLWCWTRHPYKEGNEKRMRTSMSHAGKCSGTSPNPCAAPFMAGMLSPFVLQPMATAPSRTQGPLTADPTSQRKKGKNPTKNSV